MYFYLFANMNFLLNCKNFTFPNKIISINTNIVVFDHKHFCFMIKYLLCCQNSSAAKF